MELGEYVKKTIAALTTGAADVSRQHTEVSFEIFTHSNKDGHVAVDGSGPSAHSELKLNFTLTIPLGTQE
jgi:hypothetical protein